MPLPAMPVSGPKVRQKEGGRVLRGLFCCEFRAVPSVHVVTKGQDKQAAGRRNTEHTGCTLCILRRKIRTWCKHAAVKAPVRRPLVGSTASTLLNSPSSL